MIFAIVIRDLFGELIAGLILLDTVSGFCKGGSFNKSPVSILGSGVADFDSSNRGGICWLVGEIDGGP